DGGQHAAGIGVDEDVFGVGERSKADATGHGFDDEAVDAVVGDEQVGGGANDAPGNGDLMSGSGGGGQILGATSNEEKVGRATDLVAGVAPDRLVGAHGGTEAL